MYQAVTSTKLADGFYPGPHWRMSKGFLIQVDFVYLGESLERLRDDFWVANQFDSLAIRLVLPPSLEVARQDSPE